MAADDVGGALHFKADRVRSRTWRGMLPERFEVTAQQKNGMKSTCCKACGWTNKSLGYQKLLDHLLPAATPELYAAFHGKKPDMEAGQRLLRYKQGRGVRAKKCSSLISLEQIETLARENEPLCEEFVEAFGLLSKVSDSPLRALGREKRAVEWPEQPLAERLHAASLVKAAASFNSVQEPVTKALFKVVSNVYKTPNRHQVKRAMCLFQRLPAIAGLDVPVACRGRTRCDRTAIVQRLHCDSKGSCLPWRLWTATPLITNCWAALSMAPNFGLWWAIRRRIRRNKAQCGDHSSACRH